MIMPTVLWFIGIFWGILAFFVDSSYQFQVAILASLFMIGSILTDRLDRILRDINE